MISLKKKLEIGAVQCSGHHPTRISVSVVESFSDEYRHVIGFLGGIETAVSEKEHILTAWVPGD